MAEDPPIVPSLSQSTPHVPDRGGGLELASRRAALVLAGGRSRRFGRDKALEPLAGAALVEHVARRLATGARALAVSGPEALGTRLGIPALGDDPAASRGPLAGLVQGLAWAAECGAEFLLTAPCDTPLIPRDLGARLEAEIGRGRAGPRVLAASAGRPHPLCALWSVTLLGEVRAEAARPRQQRLEDLIADLGGGFLAFPEEEDFLNVNTPGDLVRAAERLRAVSGA